MSEISTPSKTTEVGRIATLANLDTSESSAPIKQWVWPYSGATTLALASAFSYAVAFAFEAGVAGYYGYPLWMIEVRLPNVLFAFGVLVLLGFPLSMLLFFLLFSASAIPARGLLVIFRTFRRVIALLLMWWGFSWSVLGLGSDLLRSQESALVPLVVFLLSSTIFVALTVSEIAYVIRVAWRRGPGISVLDSWDALTARRAQVEKEEARYSWSEHTLAGTLLRSNWFGRPAAILFVTCVPAFVVLAVVVSIGEFTARNSRWLLVSDDSLPLVALRKYGDEIVAVYRDSEANQLTKRFVLLNPQEAGQRSWHLECVCWLAVKPVPQTHPGKLSAPTAPQNPRSPT